MSLNANRFAGPSVRAHPLSDHATTGPADGVVPTLPAGPESEPVAHRDDGAQTREAWLVRAADRLLTEFLLPVNGGVTVEFCVSVGFPNPRGRHGRAKSAGQCWSPELARDGKAHIFISPERDGSEPVAILATVLHELVHATAGCEHGHKRPFVKMARAVGLCKPYSSPTPDTNLAVRLNALAASLGPFPHGALVPLALQRPGSRLRLWECSCGVKVRVASDHFHATCGDCDSPFERADGAVTACLPETPGPGTDTLAPTPAALRAIKALSAGPDDPFTQTDRHSHRCGAN